MWKDKPSLRGPLPERFAIIHHHLSSSTIIHRHSPSLAKVPSPCALPDYPGTYSALPQWVTCFHMWWSVNSSRFMQHYSYTYIYIIYYNIYIYTHNYILCMYTYNYIYTYVYIRPCWCPAILISPDKTQQFHWNLCLRSILCSGEDFLAISANVARDHCALLRAVAHMNTSAVLNFWQGEHELVKWQILMCQMHWFQILESCSIKNALLDLKWRIVLKQKKSVQRLRNKSSKHSGSAHFR